MKTLTERQIQDLLTPVDTPAPPAGLAEAIKREIPQEIALAPEASEPTDAGAPRSIAMPGSRAWLMAASVAVAVGGGLLAYRFMDLMPAAGPPPVHVTDAAAGAGERRDAAGTAAEVREVPRVVEQASRPPAQDKDEAFAAEGEARADAPDDHRNEAHARASGQLRGVAEKKLERPEPVLPDRQRAQKGSRPAPPPAAAESAPLDVPVSPALRLPAPMPVAPPPAPRVTVERRQKEARGRAADSVESDNARIAPVEVEAQELKKRLRQVEGVGYGVVVEAPQPQAPPSTGGTAEPNDAPYGDVFFSGPGTNPFIDTEDDALSTFGLDVDTGSYTVGRRYLRDGHLPAPESVRPEEYVNYFDYGDPAPGGKDEFAIHAEGAPSIYGEGERYYLLRFNLKGREIKSADRKPALLTFVVDVSGSMGRENRLGLVKHALALLLDQLRADDRVALVVYGSRGRVVLDPTGDLDSIRRAVDGLRTEGATNAEEGLTLAYDLAARHRRSGAINRVILCSDGVANVGNTSADSILERIRREADRGIELTTVGFGMGNYNDVLMERLADDGNGRYAYVDTLEEARRIFVENLTGTLQTLAAEARLQVEFDPETVSRYRLVGYENRDIADERFRDDTVDAGEIGAGHTVTALYEIKTHRKLKARDKVATLHLRYGSIARREMVELSRTVTGVDFARRFDDASPALQLTALVAEYAEILKRSYWAREGDLDDLFRRAQKVSGRFEGDHEVADFVSLVGRAARLWERESER